MNTPPTISPNIVAADTSAASSNIELGAPDFQLADKDLAYEDISLELDSLKMGKDLIQAGILCPHQARLLVNLYYVMQDDRIRLLHQKAALIDKGHPHAAQDWLFERFKALEAQVVRQLVVYSKSTELGRRVQNVKGVGPIMAAGLMAHFDITRAPTVGHYWRFAGLDPTAVWLRKKKRPWNAKLKTLMFKLGESFVKVSKDPDAVYGQVYVQRKALEIERNSQGLFAAQAEAKLHSRKGRQDFAEDGDEDEDDDDDADGENGGRKKGGIGKKTEAYPWYAGCYSGEVCRGYYQIFGESSSEDQATHTKEVSTDQLHKRALYLKSHRGKPKSGVQMLCPAHIQARSHRYAVKLFIAHFHELSYKLHYGVEPPLPYALAILHHGHKIDFTF